MLKQTDQYEVSSNMDKLNQMLLDEMKQHGVLKDVAGR
jgi:hypothetical protein